MAEDLTMQFEIAWNGAPTVGKQGHLNVRLTTPYEWDESDDRQLKIVVTAERIFMPSRFCSEPMIPGSEYSIVFRIQASEAGEAFVGVSILHGADLIVYDELSFEVREADFVHSFT